MPIIFAIVMLSAPPAEAPKKFDFETDEVTVDVLQPDHSMEEVLRAKAHQSLFQLRVDFRTAIVRSAEDI